MRLINNGIGGTSYIDGEVASVLVALESTDVTIVLRVLSARPGPTLWPEEAIFYPAQRLGCAQTPADVGELIAHR